MSFTTTAQMRQIVGVVVNQKTDKGIPYVHIYSKQNSLNGAVTNSDGKFAIKIEQEDELVFSHISFVTSALPAKSLKADLVKVKLEPRSVELKEMTITAKEEDPGEIVLKAINKLKDNHEVEPVFYGFHTILTNFDENDSIVHILEEYSGFIYQNRQNNSTYKLKKSRIGAFSETGKRKLSDHRVIAADKMKIDNIFKYREDYLHPRKQRKYTYELTSRQLIDDRWCYVLSFNTDEDTYYKKGKLYIDMDDFTIVRKTLVNKEGTIVNQVDFTKSTEDGRWYLRSARDIHPLYRNTSVDLRYTMYYSTDPERPADQDKYQTWSPTDLAIDFASDFRDSFWEKSSYMPLPDWIRKQVQP